MNRVQVEQLLEWMNVHNYDFDEDTGQFQCSCPLAPWEHKGGFDRKPSLGIKLGKPCMVHCFACGVRGMEALVSRYCKHKGIHATAPIQQVHDRNQPTLRDKLECTDYRDYEREDPLILDEQTLEQFRPWRDSSVAADYLSNRGIDPAVADEFCLLYDPGKHRIVFPVRDRLDRLRGAVGRALDPNEKLRYDNYFNFKSAAVFGGENKLSWDTKRIYLVEGYFDLVKCYVWAQEFGGVPLCSWRADISALQASILSNYDATIYCCFDRDEAGAKGLATLNDYFGSLAGSNVVDMRPKNGDIGDCSKQDFVSLHDSASLSQNLRRRLENG